jgi:16S rRNA (uracil1498-N3)-methyltransferase
MPASPPLRLPFMPRFFCPQPLLPGTTVDLPETVAHHLHVVRQQPGDEMVLFNGQGGQVRARLSEIGKRRASAEVLGARGA